MLVSSFLVAKNTSLLREPVDAFLTFVMVLGIFYWFYKILHTLYKVTEDKDDCYYGGSYDLKPRTKPDSEYYKRYQPNSLKDKYTANEKKKIEEFAEKMSANLTIRSDIKILEINNKEKSN